MQVQLSHTDQPSHNEVQSLNVLLASSALHNYSLFVAAKLEAYTIAALPWLRSNDPFSLVVHKEQRAWLHSLVLLTPC